MAVWIILGIVYLVALLALRRGGGFGAAASAIRDWGCAVSGACRPETSTRSS
jgi:hypothetical protein